MYKLFHLFLFSFALFFLTSCNKKPPVEKIYEANPNYTWGYAYFFGNYYEDVGIENNILSLSLFTQDLFITEGALQGIGQYLYLEEICLAPADTFLVEGLYTISNTREALTALAGEVPEEFPYTIIGAHITYLEEKETVVMLIESGTFTIQSAMEEDYQITFDFVTTNGRKLNGICKGKIQHYDAQQKNKMELNKGRFNGLKSLKRIR